MEGLTGRMLTIGGLSVFVADDGRGVWIDGQLLTRSDANRLADLLTREAANYMLCVGM